MKLRGKGEIMKMKKILLTLGSLAAVASPIAAVVSCGHETQQVNEKTFTLTIPKDFVLPAPAVTATGSIDLDALLTNASKQEVLEKMELFFTGKFASAHLNGEDLDLSSYSEDFKLQGMLQAYVYQLSQKFPRIIISTPAGEKLFDPNKTVKVKQ